MSPTSYQLLYPAILLYTGIGAGDRTRTGTVLLPGDFKSPVSTIPPHRRILARIRIPHSCGIVNTLAQYFCPSTKLGPLRPSPSVSKSLAEFAARRRQKIQIIFHRDMCVGENIPQTARDCKCGIFARRRLQSFCRKNPKDFSGRVKRGPRKPGTPKFAFMGYASADQHFSNTTAVPMPPPMHRVARPFLASGRFCISWSRVTMIRAPEAPTG